MSFPIRSQTEINFIINSGQLTIADLGIQIVQEEKEGLDSSDRDHRDKMYRLILLVSYFQTILNDSGTLNNYYLDANNAKQLNYMLDAIVKLSGIYNGPAIALLAGINIPLIFVSTGSSSSSPIPPSGFVTEFDDLSVSSPSSIVDSFAATNGNFAVWFYSAKGSNPGEGSRSGVIIAIWQGSAVDYFQLTGPDVVGITTPIIMSVTLLSGVVNLLATTSTDNWSVRGLRLNLNS